MSDIWKYEQQYELNGIDLYWEKLQALFIHAFLQELI